MNNQGFAIVWIMQHENIISNAKSCAMNPGGFKSAASVEGYGLEVYISPLADG
jgi:hypothetical protein